MKAHYLTILATAVALIFSSCTKEDDGIHRSHKGHGYVDMGQAGIWATTNIGASSIFEDGDYYSWGEPWVKDEYTMDTYEGGDEDIAQALWGGKWRLPTIEECTILTNSNFYKWTMDVESEEVYDWGKKVISVKGFYVESIYGPTSGNKIYLPAAGYRELSTAEGIPSPGVVGDYHVKAYYWSSELEEDYPSRVFVLRADRILDLYTGGRIKRYSGLPVRPVLGK